MTNDEFGRTVGCSQSMASRLRGGHRRPGADLRDRIVTAFDLDPAEAMEAYKDKTGREFGKFLRVKVFATPPVTV